MEKLSKFIFYYTTIRKVGNILLISYMCVMMDCRCKNDFIKQKME